MLELMFVGCAELIPGLFSYSNDQVLSVAESGG